MTTKREKPPTRSRAPRLANLLVFLSAAALAAAVAVAMGRPPGAAAGAAPLPSQESEETLQLVIGDGGFEPAQFTRRAGKFLLTADDRRGDKSQALKLKLSRDGGEQLRDIEVPTGVVDWAEELDLPVGRYVLTEVSHPEWSCNIVIE